MTHLSDKERYGVSRESGHHKHLKETETPNRTLIRVASLVALCVAMPIAFAQTPGTPGPANPKEVGKPGTSANSGEGKSGALNSSDAKGANMPASGAAALNDRKNAMKEKRAAKKAAKGASAP
jgi:hypothetical protein